MNWRTYTDEIPNWKVSRYGEYLPISSYNNQVKNNILLQRMQKLRKMPVMQIRNDKKASSGAHNSFIYKTKRQITQIYIAYPELWTLNKTGTPCSDVCEQRLPLRTFLTQ